MSANSGGNAPPFTTRDADPRVRVAKAAFERDKKNALACGARPPRPPVLRLHSHDAKALVDMAAPTPALGWQGDGRDSYGGLRIICDDSAPRLGRPK